MLKIGEFSKLSRISIRMLRHYDEIGLLQPAQIDRFTGYRYYDEDQLAAACRIQSYKDMGFGLSAISEMLKCGLSGEKLERFFCEREAELKAELEETAYRLRLLDTAREWLRKGDRRMDYNVNVKTIPERTVAAVRMTIPSYSEEGMLWNVLMSETRDMNLVPDDPCLCSVTFYDDEFKESDVDVEAQKTVRGDYPDTEHVRFRREPAVVVASAIHNGSYKGLDEAMRFTADWVSRNGYRLSAPPFCIYHVSPHETTDESRFVTEVCYPIEKTE